MNLAVSLLGDEVVNFTPKFVGKLRSSSQVKFMSFGVVGMSWNFPDVVVMSIRNYWFSVICTLVKWEVHSFDFHVHSQNVT